MGADISAFAAPFSILTKGEEDWIVNYEEVVDRTRQYFREPALGRGVYLLFEEEEGGTWIYLRRPGAYPFPPCFVVVRFEIPISPPNLIHRLEGLVDAAKYPEDHARMSGGVRS